jgi:hypothetical protein
MADRKTLKGGLNVVKRLLTEEEPASKISKILETKKPPMTTSSGTGLPLMPREQGMYTAREQKDLPRMVGADNLHAGLALVARIEEQGDLAVAVSASI